jgi:ribonucleoside-diphosphate reductase alpha chain
MDVFDITVEAEEHSYWTGGLLVSNCAEILLRPNQFCNLSEVVCRPDDTFDTLKNKVEVATIIGTFQATLTDFRYLRSIWKKNTEEEALLGVSLTGIQDCPEIWNHLSELREHAHAINKYWAGILGIKTAAAVTCVKPSGTVSQLVDSSSGVHHRYSDYYIRRVRADKLDPLSKFLIDSGVPCEEDVTNPKSWVFSFPQKKPHDLDLETRPTRLFNDVLFLSKDWCDHSVSCTLEYSNKDFLGLLYEMYHYWGDYVCVSLLPKDDNIYKQAPYEAIDETKYNELVSSQPKLDWSKLPNYGALDSNAKQLACVAGFCEI